ncbi:hypothetical protein DM02DRAFT_672011 [Periconia macrospinosa]|uniref:3'-5' exonuclease domain-containing protein n=1 Tax=Periconia macrospinosa TaxID=97972 RepID=A0A2V1DQW5_9PLEO|nr:hypothetical protein DM02DRAFT_672011 [Periconia macrospinosa]
MIRRQRVFSARALYRDALPRLWVRRRLSTAFAALNRFRRFRSSTYALRVSSRIPPSRTRTMSLNVPMMSSSPSRPNPQNQSVSPNPSSLPMRNPRSKPDALTRDADVKIHEQRSRNGPKNYTVQSWENINNSVVALGGFHNVTGQTSMQAPFHPSPRMQKESSTNPSQKKSDPTQSSAAPENLAGFHTYVNGQDSDSICHSSSSTTHADNNETAASADQNSDLAQPNTGAEEDTKETEAESDMEATEKHIPLSYQIPADVMAAALEAPEGTKASYWSQKLYRGPNGERIATHYCTNLQISERVAKHFVEEKVLGFDIEWKQYANPLNKKENASLIQIASESRIALFQIALFAGFKNEQLVPPTLKKILESPDILKVGVAVKGDFTRLRTYLDIHARGVMELSRTHNLVEAADPTKASHKLENLASQIKTHLLLPLYKGGPLLDDPEPEDENDKLQWLKRQTVRKSDWSKKLDYDQIHYAAADAYAGIRLYDVLEFKRKQFKPPRPLPRLCDDDGPTKPRSSTKAKKARDTKEKKKLLEEKEAAMVREALLGMSTGELEEEDSQEYKTAAEELEDESDEKAERNEVEETDEDAENELEESKESEESDEEDDPDGDYVPRQYEVPHPSEGVEEVEQSPRVRTRYIGRLSFSKLRGEDPGYPKLPTLAPDEVSTAELAQDDSTHQVTANNETRHHLAEITLEEDLQEGIVNDEDSDEGVVRDDDSREEIVHEEPDEFSDRELEEVLKHVDIDDSIAQTATQAATPDDAAPSKEPELDLQPESLPIPMSTPSTTPHPPSYITATAWAQDHLDSTIPSASAHPTPQQTSRVRATVSHLRAYHMWHVQQLPVDAIGRLLRDPPLAQSTVESYIMQAVSLERLEFDKDRLRDVLTGMPKGLRYGRWKALSEKVGVL